MGQSDEGPEHGQPLRGRVAVVTGAGKGIGASCAVWLASRGARVVVAGRSEKDLYTVCGHVADCGGEALPVLCDVTAGDAVERLLREARERFGPVDVLVNNAAVCEAGAFVDQDEAAWRRMLAVNVEAVLRASRLALRDMIPRGRGVIVQVASVAGVPGVPKLPGLAAYAATKAALLAFTEALAEEVRPHGVRVVAVSPGSTKTAMLERVAPGAVEGAMHPGRVAEVVGWLATDDAAGVTGTNVVVWGPPAKPAGPDATGGAAC